MKKAFLFITLCFYGLNGAVIDEKKLTGISLAELSQTTPLQVNLDLILDLSNSNLNSIHGIGGIKVIYQGNPTKIKYIPNLHLNLSNNQLQNILPLSSLPNLIRLNLNNNQLQNISPLSSLTNLISLTLSHNQIIDISPLISLTNLWDLNLSHNQIIDLSSLNSLTSLNQLDLSHNQITILQLNLTNLYYLDLSYNQITKLPKILNSSCLCWLFLDNNKLTQLPELNLLKLYKFDLSNNQLTQLPELNLPELGHLDLSNNKLTQLTNSIGNSKKLIYMSLSGNKLITLPDSIVNLKNLRYLNLYFSGLNLHIRILDTSWYLCCRFRILKREKTAVALINPNHSINTSISKFLTKLSESRFLVFMPSEGQSEYLDMLPEDIRNIYLLPFLQEKTPKVD